MERFTVYQIAEDGSSFAVLKGSPADCSQDVLQYLAAIEDILFDAEGKEIVPIGKLRELVQTGLPKEVIVETEDDREYIDYICPKCKDIIGQRRKGFIEPYQPEYHDSCGQKLYWPPENIKKIKGKKYRRKNNMSISNAVFAGLMSGALVYGWLLPWLSKKLSEPKDMKAGPKDYPIPGYIDADIEE